MTTGTDVLRAGVVARIQSQRYGGLAKDLGVAPDTLLAFAQGGGLPVEILQRLTSELFGGHARYDADCARYTPR